MRVTYVKKGRDISLVLFYSLIILEQQTAELFCRANEEELAADRPLIQLGCDFMEIGQKAMLCGVILSF